MVRTSVKKEMIQELILIMAGSILYALSVVLFIDPIHIIPGSVTGIAVVIKALLDIPLGALNLVINVPLVLVAAFFLGKKLLVYTALTILLTSVLMDCLSFLPPFTTDMVLASVFGGILMGIGLGMILKAGATTGGTTVVGRLVVRKYPNIPIGNVLLAGDFIIITVGSLLLKNWDLMLYSLINLYICSMLNNKVIYGFDIKSAVIIHTDRSQQLADKLHDKLYCRTIQLPTGNGLVCYLSKSSLHKLQKIVQEVDSSAACASVNLDYCFGEIGTPGNMENKE